MRITIDPFDKNSIDKALKDAIAYKNWVATKETELLERLASIGATKVSLGFARSIYRGTNDVKVSALVYGDTAVIKAEGESVAFIEFGAGIRYGYGHPMNSELGVGPGTYNPDSDKWANPKGWWYTNESTNKSEHTYGNPPAMAMWNAKVELEEIIGDIAREVFR